MAVLTVIGLLTYFGVMNPKTLLPEQCMATYSLTCAGKAYTNSTESMIVLENNMNYAFNLSSARTILSSGCNRISFCDKSGLNCENSRIIPIMDQFMIRLSCDNSESSRVHREFYMNYTNPLSGLEEDTKVYIISKINH